MKYLLRSLISLSNEINSSILIISPKHLKMKILTKLLSILFLLFFALSIHSQVQYLSSSIEFEQTEIHDLIASADFTYTDDYSIFESSIENTNHTDDKIEKARCFCRVGDNRGSRLKEYSNPIKDLGVLKSWGGAIGATNKREDECGNLCSKKAWEWYNSGGKQNICNKLRSNRPIRITAYSKVGGRDWVTRGDYGSLKCCSTGGQLTCPSGWHSENKNFPGMCAKAMCPPLIKGDRRLYNEDRTAWGYIWKDMTYQLAKGKISPTSWKPCH